MLVMHLDFFGVRNCVLPPLFYIETSSASLTWPCCLNVLFSRSELLNLDFVMDALSETNSNNGNNNTV